MNCLVGISYTTVGLEDKGCHCLCLNGMFGDSC